MNTVQLVGHLGSDPKVQDAGDSKVCILNVATTYKAEDKEHTTWHRVQVWGNSGRACAEILKKGRAVAIEGRIDNFEYEKEGQKLYGSQVVAHRVHFLGANPDNKDSGSKGGGKW